MRKNELDRLVRRNGVPQPITADEQKLLSGGRLLFEHRASNERLRSQSRGRSTRKLLILEKDITNGSGHCQREHLRADLRVTQAVSPDAATHSLNAFHLGLTSFQMVNLREDFMRQLARTVAGAEQHLTVTDVPNDAGAGATVNKNCSCSCSVHPLVLARFCEPLLLRLQESSAQSLNGFFLYLLTVVHQELVQPFGAELSGAGTTVPIEHCKVGKMT
mmetsp:Transcript_1769/g.4840  ORF Transcript_1769/g.4840 Transcript_1769/m.4840 type:complete len:218 (-) Transcript_1769:573-1226(-)